MEADQDLKEQLSQYTSSFNIENDFSTLKPKYLKQKICDIENEMEDFKTPMEKCRALNLLSYLNFQVGNTQSALQYNDKSIEAYTGNIIGLCNRGWFLIREHGKYKDVQDLCVKLEEDSKDPLKMIIAKAELAYTYARLGIQFYRKASEIYQEAILEAKEYAKPCLQQSIELEENICVWSFGCALAQVRLFNTFNVCKESDLKVPKECVVSASELSAYIIKSKWKSPTLENLKPRAYVLLGLVAQHIRWNKPIYPNQFLDILPNDQDLHMFTDEHFNKALEHQNEDSFVLERCGKHFKSKNANKAITIFRRAIESRPSSFSYHHLALTLKDQLIKSIKRESSILKSEKVFEKGHSGSHKSSKRESIDKSLLKNPQKLPNIDYEIHKEKVDEILVHLEKAEELGMNRAALYDKGLLLRQVGKVYEAKDAFMKIINDKERKVSLVVLANAYEQVGYCCQEILETDQSTDRESDNEDMIMAFKMSLALSCEIVAKVPQLKNCWKSAPTLETLLSGQANTKKKMKDLLFLHEKLQAFSKIIDILEQLLIEFHSESHSEQIEICTKLVENYSKVQKFDDAVLLLHFLKCLPDWPSFLNTELFISTNIEGAYFAFRQGNKEAAIMRFDNALEFRRSKQALAIGGGSNSADEPNHAILILCDQNREDNGLKLQQVLEHLGVKATLNFNDVLGFGRLYSELLIEVVQASNHFVVIYDFDHTTDGNDAELLIYVDIMIRLVKERRHGHILTLVSSRTNQSNVPKTLPNQFIFDFRCIENKETSVDVVKNFLFRLA